MRELDDTDLEVLRLLVEDARRPYSEIADRVNVSPPTVSDRVERLAELELQSDVDDRVANRLADAEHVEHAYLTADARLYAHATVPEGGVRETIRNAIDMALVEDLTVRVLESESWEPTVSDAELRLSCAECANAVAHDGVTTQVDGDLFHFCSDDCHETFAKRYAGLPSQA
jgi:Lrp/AsnC family leucine-responsive transcriptional regulator